MKKQLARMLSILLVLIVSIGILPGRALAASPQYQYGTLEYFTKVTNEYTGDSYYYTDRWFAADPAVKNDRLALLSAQLSATAARDPDHAAAFLKQLGFQTRAVRYDSTSPGDCAYVIGTGTVQDGARTRKLTAVVFQGAEYGDKGWQQNVTVNGTNTGENIPSEHAAFSAAAQSFMEDYTEMDMGSGDVIWLTGQSRGAAVANLAAARILEQKEHPAVFAYTFESPAVTEAADAHGKTYKTIFNYIADDDPVTMIPMWGMTRFGQEIIYNTESVEAVTKQLGKMNAAAVEYAKAYDAMIFGGDVKAYLQGLVNGLAAAVPARGDYSKVNRDSFVNEKGETVSVSYTYQAGLQALCHIVFGGEGTPQLASAVTGLAEYLPDLTYACLEEAYVKAQAPADSGALCMDAAGRYWIAAGAWYNHVAEGQSGAPFEREDLYALLKLLVPMLVDTDAVAESDFVLPEYGVDITAEYMDISMLTSLMVGAKTLTFSHQPDVILARLKMAAPAPEMGNVSLDIAAPKAGEPKGRTPGEAAAAVTELGESWMTPEEAFWLTEDRTLRNNKKYYLSVTLASIGHSLPEDFRFTLNGADPVDRHVVFKDGKTLITGIWAISVGTPETVSVNFDANGHGESPGASFVEAGTLLKYAGLEPGNPGIVEDELGAWQFEGWYDEKGTPWEEITANQDVTLRAKWVRLIDEINLTYEIPFVGDSGEALYRITAPEGGPYRLDEFSIIDEQYNNLSVLSPSDRPILCFKIFLLSGDAEFLAEKGEYGPEFAGRVTINGEEIEDPFYEDYTDPETGIRDVFLSVEYPFTPRKDPSYPSGFVDVPADSYFADAVEWAVDRGITAGVSATRFAPDQTCTRGQMVTFLWRAAGEPEPSSDGNPFEDVSEEDYYGKAVLWAVEQDITKGTDEAHFSPGAEVTRGQSVTFLYRMTGEPAEGENPFRDVSEKAYYYDPVLWAVEKGVTTGVSADRFAPGSNCTRAQVVTFLYRALGE